MFLEDPGHYKSTCLLLLLLLLLFIIVNMVVCVLLFRISWENNLPSSAPTIKSAEATTTTTTKNRKKKQNLKKLFTKLSLRVCLIEIAHKNGIFLKLVLPYYAQYGYVNVKWLPFFFWCFSFGVIISTLVCCVSMFLFSSSLQG